MDMLEDLLRAIEAKTTNPGVLRLYSLGTWVDTVKNQYNIICDKNSNFCGQPTIKSNRSCTIFFPSSADALTYRIPNPPCVTGQIASKRIFCVKILQTAATAVALMTSIMTCWLLFSSTFH